MKHAAVAVAVVLFGLGCSQHVYSPPSQAFVLAPIRALPGGAQALDLEAATHGQIFDPNVDTGAARLRTGIGDNSEISVEGMAAYVQDSGVSTADRNFYTGRVGFRSNPERGPISLFGGLGGGYSRSGGGFGAVDTGISVGFVNCTFVPIASASVFFSKPFSPTPIDVTDDRDTPTTSTPSRTFGSVLRGGFRVSLSPSECRAGHQVPWIYSAFDLTNLADTSQSATLFGLGAGIEIPL